MAAAKSQPQPPPPGVPPEGQAAAAPREGAKPPPHGTAAVAEHGPVPRVVKELERAPKGAGLARFKCRCQNYGPAPILYVLAADEASAAECFLRESGAGTLHAKAKKAAADAPPPDVVVTRLED